ncbi:MAG: hypothetical protein IJ880_15085 [Bacilli bacterium]|nr:hypothetical protein [Bacilli bacterium]
MTNVKIGSVINGFEIVKLIFKSSIPLRSIYKVKCVYCGKSYKLRLMDLKTEVCECKTYGLDPDREFDYEDPKKDIGIVRGKYTVIGFIRDKDKPEFVQYIVRCNVCNKLCVMKKTNLFKTNSKSTKKCNHKTLFSDVQDNKIVYIQ